MTPQERQLVAELFERLARLEATPRERDAERAIADGLARAPNAVYPLVQTVLLQDEALKRADARIRALEGGDAAPRAGGFLDNMRDALAGRPAHASVPSVRAASASGPDPRWNSGGAIASAAPSQGGSFLGTAAAAAAGVIGGSLLLGGIQSMFGRHGNASAAYNPSAGGQSPWDAPRDAQRDGNASASDLAREAGVDDIAGSGQRGLDDDRAGLLDSGNEGGGDLDVGGGDFSGGDSA